MYKSSVNSNKELFKWGPIEGRPLYLGAWVGFLYGETKSNKKDIPWSWPKATLVFENNKLTYISNRFDFEEIGKKYFKSYLLNKTKYQNLWRRWGKWVLQYHKMANFLDKTDLQSLSSQELAVVYRDFHKFIDSFWSIVHIPEIANYGGEPWVLYKLKKIYPHKAEQYLEILLSPVKYSFFQQEEIDLLRLASIKNKKRFNEALVKHAQKYCWLLNSYGGNKILDKKYFEKQLKHLLLRTTLQEKKRKIIQQIVRAKKKKKDLIKELKLGQDTKLAVEQLSHSIWWQDLRKGYIWRLQYYEDKLVKEVGRRYRLKFNDLVWFWSWEILQLIEGKKLNYKKIISRSKIYLWVSDKNKVYEYYGGKAKVILKKYETKVKQNTKYLKGLVVSKGHGNIKGRVKIIKNPFDDQKKMKPGDILVASMTSPEFVVLMRQASAIITDEGGMTSHAAVVSRELGVPCIVRTRIATRVFKDGDMVEVDTNKGTVRKVK